MPEVYTMRAARGVMVGEPRVSWVTGGVEMAFMPPMSDEELAEVRALELPNDFTIVHEVPRGEVSRLDTPIKVPATILEIGSEKSGVQGGFSEQINQAAMAHAKRLPAAIGALTKWWMDKSNPDPEKYRLIET